MQAAGRARWRWLFLPLLVAVGVVAMHSVVPDGHGQPSHGPGSVHMAMSIQGTGLAPEAHLPVPGLPVPGSGGLAGLPGSAQAPIPITADHEADLRPAWRAEDGLATEDSGPLPALHALLHLCVAVLAGGVVIAALMLLVVSWPGLSSSARLRGVHRGVVRPRAPPLGAPDRLSRLCVMRN